jgi:hypothetical protein
MKKFFKKMALLVTVSLIGALVWTQFSKEEEEKLKGDKLTYMVETEFERGWKSGYHLGYCN